MSTILRLLCLGPALLLLAGCVVTAYPYATPGVTYEAPVYVGPPAVGVWPFYFGGHHDGYGPHGGYGGGGWHGGGGGWYGGGRGHH